MTNIEKMISDRKKKEKNKIEGVNYPISSANHKDTVYEAAFGSLTIDDD